jgi:hypothetical protein
MIAEEPGVIDGSPGGDAAIAGEYVLRLLPRPERPR